jgi:UPF0716 protein FxsA
MIILFLLLVVAPLLELYGIIQVASVIGGLDALALLVLFTVVGVWLVRREGVTVVRRIQAALDQGRLPHKELIDGFLLLLAGVLMILPGFISDIVGLLLLIPPIRVGVRMLILRNMARRGWSVRVIGGANGPRGWFGATTVYDVTAEEHPTRPPSVRRPDELGP